ncbi:MAG: ABC transporter permease, partial [Rhodoplanes sp.]
VISHALWRDAFQGEERAIGATIRIDGLSYEVIGVADAATAFPSGDTDLWVPMQLNAVGGQPFDLVADVVARLRPGIPLDQQHPTDLMSIRRQFLEFEGDLGYIVVHGHTPVLLPEFKQNRINLDTGAFYRRADGQRETKKRQPPIRLPDRLLAHIRRWKRKGLCHKHVVEWNGDPVARIVKAFRRAVADAGLDSEVTPHTLRHTAASWGMQNGADHGELADYLGMTIETLRRVYGHHDPNYLSDARDAIVRKPNFTERLKATKQEQTSSGIAKLYRNH